MREAFSIFSRDKKNGARNKMRNTIIASFAALSAFGFAGKALASDVDAPENNPQSPIATATATIEANINAVTKPVIEAPAAMGDIANAVLKTKAGAKPEQINRVASTVVALRTAIEVTDGTLDGSLENVPAPALIAENLVVAGIESGFNSEVVTSPVNFKNPENRTNRPAGLYQFEARFFATILAAHKDELNLTEEQRAAYTPLFNNIDEMANRYAARTGQDAETIKRTPSLFRAAFRSAPANLQNAVRYARIDSTPIAGVGGWTTNGALISTVAKIYSQDDIPPPPKKKYVDRPTWNYLVHMVGLGGANALTGQKAGISQKQLNVYLRGNPSITMSKGRIKTADRIFSDLKRQKFSGLRNLISKVAASLESNIEAIAAQTAPQPVFPISTPRAPLGPLVLTQ